MLVSHLIFRAFGNVTIVIIVFLLFFALSKFGHSLCVMSLFYFLHFALSKQLSVTLHTITINILHLNLLQQELCKYYSSLMY